MGRVRGFEEGFQKREEIEPRHSPHLIPLGRSGSLRRAERAASALAQTTDDIPSGNRNQVVFLGVFQGFPLEGFATLSEDDS